jgi:hypothetical protein
MPTFNLTLAVAVQAYGHVQIEAATMAEALEIVRAHAADPAITYKDPDAANHWDGVTDIEWDTQDTFRVLTIEDEATGKMVDGIDLTEMETRWRVIDADQLAQRFAQQLADETAAPEQAA